MTKSCLNFLVCFTDNTPSKQVKMSTIFTSRLMFYLLGILFIAAKLTAGRPQNSIENQVNEVSYLN
jgi:hypothetical protein